MLGSAALSLTIFDSCRIWCEGAVSPRLGNSCRRGRQHPSAIGKCGRPSPLQRDENSGLCLGRRRKHCRSSPLPSWPVSGTPLTASMCRRIENLAIWAATRTGLRRCRCFNAVAREKVPELMSHLVEGVRPAREERPQAKPNMQQPQFVYCPFCLGTGQRSGWNAAQQPVSVCPECKGRGFLESTPDPASL